MQPTLQQQLQPRQSTGVSLEDLRKILQETQQQEKKDLTLEQIKVGLPIKTQRELATVLVPLSKGEKMLSQQDLSHFWERCECALNGLSSEFQVQDLKASHLRQLCPIVLGTPVWTLLKNQLLDT